MFTVVAFKMLELAGHRVTAADRVPGLWNVDGLAHDVTTAQLHQLAQQHGHPWPPVVLIGPQVIIDQVS
jgi:hypothetical protein